MASNSPTRPGYDPPPIEFKSIVQQYTVGPGDDGRATSGYLISFVTTTNIKGSLFVPLAVYTDDEVNRRLQQHAGTLVRIASQVKP